MRSTIGFKYTSIIILQKPPEAENKKRQVLALSSLFKQSICDSVKWVFFLCWINKSMGGIPAVVLI
jgi:hypothetical protein